MELLVSSRMPLRQCLNSHRECPREERPGFMKMIPGNQVKVQNIERSLIYEFYIRFLQLNLLLNSARNHNQLHLP